MVKLACRSKPARFSRCSSVFQLGLVAPLSMRAITDCDVRARRARARWVSPAVFLADNNSRAGPVMRVMIAKTLSAFKSKITYASLSYPVTGSARRSDADMNDLVFTGVETGGTKILADRGRTRPRAGGRPLADDYSRGGARGSGHLHRKCHPRAATRGDRHCRFWASGAR